MGGVLYKGIVLYAVVGRIPSYSKMFETAEMTITL
jgi:hypothetical protein